MKKAFVFLAPSLIALAVTVVVFRYVKPVRDFALPTK